jgi:ligand-binding SRPBCC domain-containing protein
VATRIVIDTFIRAPVEVCFDLALSVEAHAESAAFSGERVVEPGRLTGTLQSGDMITFEGKHFGVRQRFSARIGAMDRPRFFVDDMVKGMFKRLNHVHEFHPHEGGTLMRDILEWETPLGVLGRIADRLFLRRHMTWFVATKQSHLKVMAERGNG